MSTKHKLSAVLTTALIGLAAAFPANSEPLAKETLGRYDNPTTDAEKTLFKVMMHGMYQGVSWSTSVAESTGGSPLYCEPSDLAMNLEMVIGILRSYAETLENDIPIGLAMVEALQKTFPCE
ncbi:hypothetical protein J7413_19675 [Shimia sp. R10_1]|uniref:hypothetical protein n=1 Tax=Shimia sp. R10_1 TaxID=2821095 RepID=UPI001ADBB60D|nr:hypothetical protein [Shimia sp. R10_1]MBO9475762.1 hypothetical protein [Shimia sp. R10_1]